MLQILFLSRFRKPASLLALSRRLIRLLVAKQGISHGHVHDADVEPEAPVFNVPDVFLDAVFHLPQVFGFAACAGYLGPAGDAGLDEVAHHVFIDQRGVFFGVAYHVRTGADDAHVAQEDVDELRQLVDAGVAHDVAPLGLARVVLGGLELIGLVVYLHAAELQAVELFAQEAVALLLEEHGAGHGDLGDEGYDEVDPPEAGDEEDARHDDVERALQVPVVAFAQGLAAQAQHGHIGYHFDFHAAVYVVAYVGHAVEADEVAFAVVDELYNFGAARRGEVAEQHLRALVLVHPLQGFVYVAQARGGAGQVVADVVVKVADELVAGADVVDHALVQVGQVVAGADEDDAAAVAADGAQVGEQQMADVPADGEAEEQQHREAEHAQETEVGEAVDPEVGGEYEHLHQGGAEGSAGECIGRYVA